MEKLLLEALQLQNDQNLNSERSGLWQSKDTTMDHLHTFSKIHKSATPYDRCKASHPVSSLSVDIPVLRMQLLQQLNETFSVA